MNTGSPDADFRFIDMEAVRVNQGHVAAAIPRSRSTGKPYRTIYVGTEGVTIAVQWLNDEFLAFSPLGEGEGVYTSRPTFFDTVQSCLELRKKLKALEETPQIEQP